MIGVCALTARAGLSSRSHNPDLAIHTKIAAHTSFLVYVQRFCVVVG